MSKDLKYEELVGKLKEYVETLAVEERSYVLEALVVDAVRDLDGVDWVEIYGK